MPGTELTDEEIADGWTVNDWYIVRKTRVDGQLVEFERWRVGFERRLTDDEKELLFPEVNSPLELAEFVSLAKERIPHVAILRQREQSMAEDE